VGTFKSRAVRYMYRIELEDPAVLGTSRVYFAA
jgi:hypothetical protein